MTVTFLDDLGTANEPRRTRVRKGGPRVRIVVAYVGDFSFCLLNINISLGLTLCISWYTTELILKWMSSTPHACRYYCACSPLP